MNFDLVIRNGVVIDGTGAPGREGDVAVSAGKIVAIGKVAGRGAEEIDAKGKLVTPGFVDLHTHYDGQVVWDKHTAPSCWHGVTTAIMGNCGVGFAPCRPADREKLVALMEGVEDIPGPVMHEGLNWQWETFADYLDLIERRQGDIDIGALLPHSAVRVYVMGDRAIRHEQATDDDVAAMRRITAEAIRAGAFGVSTSRTVSHKTLSGDLIPTMRAAEDELTGLALGMKDAGSGFLELVTDWNFPDPKTEFDMLRRISVASGRPTLFTLVQKHEENLRGIWKEVMKYSDQAVAEGVSIRAVFAPRAVGAVLGLEASQNPFSGTPTYKSIAHLPLAERVAMMQRPEIRQRILSEDPIAGATFALIKRLKYDQMFLLGNPVNYTPQPDESLAAIAAREGRTGPEVCYDALIDDGGRNFLYAPLVNYHGYNLDGTEAMLKNRNAIMGISDGGAHVASILDAGFPTWMFTYWGRQRKLLSVEEIVRRLTSDTAHAAGLLDRGTIAPGLKADFNIIDEARLNFSRPYVQYDLPSGGRRLLQKAYGYDATIVSGKVTYREGQPTGSLPGKLLRGQRTAPA